MKLAREQRSRREAPPELVVHLAAATEQREAARDVVLAFLRRRLERGRTAQQSTAVADGRKAVP